MPNDCWNAMIITGSKDDITQFIENELRHVPDWALRIKEQGLCALSFDLWSRWSVDTKWLEGLLNRYSSLWIKNHWKVAEIGTAGLWVGSRAEGIRHFEWTEPCLQEWNELVR